MAVAHHGWKVGENLLVEHGWSELKMERVAPLAEEFVRKRVHAIVAFGALPAWAAARATSNVPVLFTDVTLPVEEGLIDSFARPGRNVTGVAVTRGIEVTFKRLQWLREAAPGAKRLSWLWPATFLSRPTVAGGQFDMVPMLTAAAKSLGFEPRFHAVDTESEVDAAFRDMAAWPAQALIAAADSRRLPELALNQRLPSAFWDRAQAEAGGLLSFGTSQSETDYLDVRLAWYLDRVLNGVRPADLPVEWPSRYELVVNLKTAKLLGLTIPQSLLLRADEVLQ